MERQQWKDLLEVIGFLAIIGSLYFVGLETRNSAEQTAQNTQAIEISAYQQLTANITEMNAMTLEDSEAAGVLLEARGADPANPRQYRLLSAYFMTLRHGDIAYFMYERGAIDEERLRSTLRPLPLANERGIEFWENNKHVFVPGYRDYIDGLIAEDFWNRGYN